MSNESMRRDAWKIIRKTLKEAMPDQAVEKALRARSFTKPGRVLGVTAKADTLQEALDKAYHEVDKIHFENCFSRRDIGQRALQAK